MTNVKDYVMLSDGRSGLIEILRRRLIISRVARIVAWFLAGAIVVLSIVSPEMRPQTDVPHNLEHFLIFWLTALAFGLGYRTRHGLLTILLVIFSGAVEIAQLFVPGRHARLSDFIVDALAMCVGVILASLARRLWPRI